MPHDGYVFRKLGFESLTAQEYHQMLELLTQQQQQNREHTIDPLETPADDLVHIGFMVLSTEIWVA